MAEPIFTGRYFAAFSEELSENKSFIGLIHPCFRFRHKGKIIINQDGILLTGLKEIHFNETIKIELSYDSVYNRFWAGRIVGQYPSPAFFFHGKPLIIEFSKGDRKKRLYLLINWRFLSGFTDNEHVYKIINRVLTERYCNKNEL